MKKVSIIIPTYNEAENIKDIAIAAHKELLNIKQNHEIIIVDDNSPDGTGKIAQVLEKKYPWIKTIVQKNGEGIASAVKEGIINATGTVIVKMNADFTHPPNVLPILLDKIKGVEVVLASRYMRGGRSLGSNIKFFFSRILNFYVRILLLLTPHDVTGGFFSAKKSVFKKLDMDKIFYG